MFVYVACIGGPGGVSYLRYIFIEKQLRCSCEIEDFVDITHVFKLWVALGSRVLRGVYVLIKDMV